MPPSRLPIVVVPRIEERPGRLRRWLYSAILMVVAPLPPVACWVAQRAIWLRHPELQLRLRLEVRLPMVSIFTEGPPTVDNGPWMSLDELDAFLARFAARPHDQGDR